ncbi:protein kinase [Archangium violaceum]|uniref:serine/threonine-protein kinase n=1 Tax=Archangium violaceum TaxID=83451 RepID=UPI00193B1925|nr:serine/threonine-protein kinase [Archangium violaceum]QRK10131.1 protein kinase [Archangium violaceum]
MSSIEPGTSVGRYRVIRLLAQGGMAEVYRAEQALAGGIVRPVALKVIRPEYSESEDFREMFLDEARTACTLSHPNIVHIYEVGDADGLLYMAMELVPGESLAEVERVLRQRGERFTDEALLAVGISTCAALEAVHARPNLVHRDVSPQNLLLTAAGSLKLIDFGISKAATNRNLTRAGTTKGKAGYFSPEQARGKPLDGRSDLFSLGVTLYQLAAGVGPLDAYPTLISRNTALVRGEWEPLSRVCPELPRGLLAVVERAMRLKPEERYPDARAMREELESVAFAAGLPVGPGSLAGYVREEGEEISVSRSSPRRTRGRASGLSPVSTPSRAQASRLPGGRKVWAPVAGVVVGLGLSLAAGAILLPGEQPVAVAPPVAVAQPVPVVPPVATTAPEPARPAEPEALAPVAASEPARAQVSRPKRESKRSREQARTGAASAPAAPEEVLEGEGELRLGTVPALMGKATVVLPERGREEMPLTLRRWKAGRYELEFSSPEGPARCGVKVRPEKRTLVVFDGKGCKIQYLD